jgi:hypothetical protein
MRTLFYASGSFLTGDDIANALSSYATFLIERRSAASIDIPIRNVDGSDGRVTLVLGPSTVMASRTEPFCGPEIKDEALVRRLLDRSEGRSISTIHDDQSDQYVDAFGAALPFEMKDFDG